MAEHWYDALKRDSDAVEISGRGKVRWLDQATPMERSTGTELGAVREREVDRLARMNERLLTVMEEVLRLQGSEQAPAPGNRPAQGELFIQGAAVDHEAIARVVRETLDNQMKPVLSALLRLIELQGGAPARNHKPAQSLAPSETPAEQPAEEPDEALGAPAPDRLASPALIAELAPREEPTPTVPTPVAGPIPEPIAPPAVPLSRRPDAVPLPSFLTAPRPTPISSELSPAERRAQAARERKRARLAAALPIALGWVEVIS